MISQTNSSALRSAYATAFGETKDTKQTSSASVSKQGDTSKIEKLKEAIDSGEYKVDLQALSEKIAQELL
jgi:anti-sigma28 factor (negative regulator of flagellin synthesis)